MATPTGDRETILKVIEAWPREEQVALAQQILRREIGHVASPQRPSWRHLAGLASNGQSPPSDEQVAQWLDEHRTEKYG